MFGVDPKVLAFAQGIGSQVNGQIIIDYKEDSITLKLSPKGPDARKAIDFLMDQFPETFGKQLTVFFGIRGDIVKRNESAKGG